MPPGNIRVLVVLVLFVVSLAAARLVFDILDALRPTYRLPTMTVNFLPACGTKNCIPISTNWSPSRK